MNEAHRASVGTPNVKQLGAATISGLAARRFFIEDIYPIVECGRFAVKRVAGEPVDVWADIVRDGHEVTAAGLRWRRESDAAWNTVPMRHHGNDRGNLRHREV